MYYDQKRYWAEKNSHDKRRLQERIANTDIEIKDILFAFDKIKLNAFFREYEKRYGRRAMLYARTHFDEWKAKNKTVSYLILSRMVSIAPRFFEMQQRNSIIRTIYETSKPHEDYNFYIVLEQERGIDELGALFDAICQKPFSHNMSEKLKGVMSWVVDNDVQAYSNLLAALDAEYSMTISQFAKQEMLSLIEKIRSLDKSAVGRHFIKFPFGTVSIYVRHPTITENFVKGLRQLLS